MKTLAKEYPEVHRNGTTPATQLPGTAPDDKLPPFDEFAEKNVIGGILYDGGLLPDIIKTGLKASDFYIEKYGWMFVAAIDVYHKGQDPTVVTIASRLRDKGQLDEAGGTLGLEQIERETQSPYSAPSYAQIVVEKAQRRSILPFWPQVREWLDEGSRQVYDETKEPELTPSKFVEVVQAYAGEFTQNTTPIFQPITFNELLSMPPKQWLIKDIIGPGDLGVIFGDSGSAKTFLVIDLIMSAITGLSWARKFEVAEPLTVAYCTNEGLGGLPQRFQAAQKAYEATSEDLERFTFFPAIPQLFKADTPAYISRFVSDYRATRGDHLDLLIIDTLDNASLGSKENDNNDASQIAEATRIARDALGCATILIHHAGKSGDYRGASAYKGDCDIMLKTERKAEGSPYIEFSCFKSKDEKQFDPLVFTLWLPDGSNSPVVSWQGLASENLGKTSELLAAMKEMPGQRLTAKQWGEAVGVEQNHAIAILSVLHKAGKVLRELQFEDKKKSSRNPFVYFVQ